MTRRGRDCREQSAITMLLQSCSFEQDLVCGLTHPRNIWLPHFEQRKNARRPVSRVLSRSWRPGAVTAIPLGRPLPDASRDLPGRRRGNAARRSLRVPCRPYLVLLPVGFALPPPLPAARCALTAPFHPCRLRHAEVRRGGLLSVALSLGSPPPGVTRHRVSVEPGLSSLRAKQRRAAIRPSGAASGRRCRCPRQLGLGSEKRQLGDQRGQLRRVPPSGSPLMRHGWKWR